MVRNPLTMKTGSWMSNVSPSGLKNRLRPGRSCSTPVGSPNTALPTRLVISRAKAVASTAAPTGVSRSVMSVESTSWLRSAAPKASKEPSAHDRVRCNPAGIASSTWNVSASNVLAGVRPAR